MLCVQALRESDATLPFTRAAASAAAKRARARGSAARVRETRRSAVIHPGYKVFFPSSAFLTLVDDRLEQVVKARGPGMLAEHRSRQEENE